jgi:hypothetical protein
VLSPKGEKCYLEFVPRAFPCPACNGEQLGKLTAECYECFGSGMILNPVFKLLTIRGEFKPREVTDARPER